VKVVSKNKELEKLLVRLIKKYDEVLISVAWASAKTEVFKVLLQNKNKIKETTIGTHFFQTDPVVLETFVDSENVKFIMQSNGVFHPKVYFFRKSDKWEAVLGSANMTVGAMSSNNEISLHISSEDIDSEGVKSDLLESITGYFHDAKTVSKDDANIYALTWRIQQSKLDKLSGKYGQTKSTKSLFESEIRRLDWNQYSKAVKADPYHGISERLELLDMISHSFNQYSKYSDMPIGTRKTIAGLPNDDYKNWGWFGSMRGAGVYHSNINNNNVYISDALEQIPLTGSVNKKQYMRFIENFVKAFPNGRDGIGTASRLLAMKRPDVFVCIDAKNNSSMCQDFGIKVSGMTYERYWSELICRIHDSIWFQSDLPKNKMDQRIWENRVALLDCIFYDHKA